jgi:hypothetical protein
VVIGETYNLLWQGSTRTPGTDAPLFSCSGGWNLRSREPTYRNVWGQDYFGEQPQPPRYEYISLNLTAMVLCRARSRGSIPLQPLQTITRSKRLNVRHLCSLSLLLQHSETIFMSCKYILVVFHLSVNVHKWITPRLFGSNSTCDRSRWDALSSCLQVSDWSELDVSLYL